MLRNFDFLPFLVLIGILRHLRISPRIFLKIGPDLGRLNRNRTLLLLKFVVFSQYFLHFRKYAKMSKTTISRHDNRIFLTCVLQKSDQPSLRSEAFFFFAFLQFLASFLQFFAIFLAYEPELFIPVILTCNSPKSAQ